MRPTATPASLLAAEVRRDGSRPFLTFYDDATGERVELSTTTFDNWVAKTAGLLSDGLDTDPGDRVALLLPAHWQALAWTGACWSVGACVTLPAALTSVDDGVSLRAVVVGPDHLEAATKAPGADAVALALRPMGGRFTSPLPDGVLDYAVEVPGYPDQVAVAAPEPDEPALDHDGAIHTLGGLVERARQRAEQLGAAPGSRFYVGTDDLGAALLDAFLVPLVVGGSAVLVRHENECQRAGRITTEKVTIVM